MCFLSWERKQAILFIAFIVYPLTYSMQVFSLRTKQEETSANTVGF